MTAAPFRKRSYASFLNGAAVNAAGNPEARIEMKE
jgi:hypothetical protein